MSLIVFYLKQVLLLGTPAFVAWLVIGWLHLGFFWASDTPLAWLFALFLVAIFIVLVATPLQVLSRLIGHKGLPYLVGCLSGPLAVWIGLATQTRYPVDFEWYVNRTMFFHVIFAAVGLLFAFSFQRRFGLRIEAKLRELREA